jgi:hypothetical protein
MEPRKIWDVLAWGHFRVRWTDGTTWHLRATPKERYPWVLYSGEVVQQIGPTEVADAQAMAEFWLGLTCGRSPYPMRGVPA